MRDLTISRSNLSFVSVHPVGQLPSLGRAAALWGGPRALPSLGMTASLWALSLTQSKPWLAALPRVRVRTVLPRASSACGTTQSTFIARLGHKPWQSLVAPQRVILNVSEESPTRLYAVNALSLVGSEEILRCRSG